MRHRNEDTGADFAAACCVLAIMMIITILMAAKAADKQAAIDAANTKAFVDQMDPEVKRIVGGGK